MNEPTCSATAELEDLRASWSKISQQISSPAATGFQQEPGSAPFKQLMCSLNAAEVEAVRAELSRAGIQTETRKNLAAEALGVNGIELWVKHEKDFAEAAKLYTKAQARNAGRRADTAANACGEPGKSDLLVGEKAGEQRSCTPRESSAEASDGLFSRLHEDAGVLEKKIEDMLEFQREVLSECASVRGNMKGLREALINGQATVTVENEKRAAIQRRQAEEISRLKETLERDRLDLEQTTLQLKCEQARRESAEEQLGRERQDWEQKSKAREDTLEKAEEKIELQSRLLQNHAAAVLKLRKEVEALELQKREQSGALTRLRQELAAEQKARVAAEDKAKTAAAQASLGLPSLLFRRLSAKAHRE